MKMIANVFHLLHPELFFLEDLFIPFQGYDDTPLNLLIQFSTSLCQTREFSGFKTHYIHISICARLLYGRILLLTWFSSGNMRSLLGMLRACSTLNMARPSATLRR